MYFYIKCCTFDRLYYLVIEVNKTRNTHFSLNSMFFKNKIIRKFELQTHNTLDTIINFNNIFQTNLRLKH